MTAHKPTLLISNVLPSRPGDPMYDALIMCLWERIITAASSSWNIIREYAQLDGPEGIPLRAHEADAIIVMGGEDVHPSCYGKSQGYEDEGRHWLRADHAQLALARYAAATNTPLVGICRGMQILNVAFGGTLTQHIESGEHNNPLILEDRIFVRHPVTIAQNTQLASIYPGHERLDVSSAHHQCVEELGTDLAVSARAEDGIVEAIEHTRLPILGVQWHPEDPAAPIGDLEAILEYLRMSRLHQEPATLDAAQRQIAA
ncbi:gamma-glutamyl-gamma-aminobutyrate hydrolase family protein [Schaalia sp. ZJ405]|uniref:gamma-glutamyl-gamma-aminobutyrate hydrolase family protein n=1 Tax=Schaalia sp. ZJ405 TaxID=2709403 RepID=UPI0013ED8C93|nr:gamma-glutamyl-gamma-aminobutyrate hydrolase family protein [Schaalia sp. ZJ405]QPK80631.1 gamma-glutamyl-gamma-aminobutyrate hydrolase family protein [Schaalia sp. ZJ405]